MCTGVYRLVLCFRSGVQSFRTRFGDGQPLPSARLVSRTINEDRDLPHHIQSLWVMVWGQFIDHDLSLTALSKDVVDPSGEKTIDLACGVFLLENTWSKREKIYGSPDVFDLREKVEDIDTG